MKNVAQQAYGDLTELNTCRLILDTVGKDVLASIVSDCIDLLGTSSAVYEKNGDYAYGIFSSGWCKRLDSASRAQCATSGNREALACGKWHCHESCWNCCSKVAMATGGPIDIECSGGLRLYGIPIEARGDIIGAINFAYGSLPRDPARLQEISRKFGISLDELRLLAEDYTPAPAHIVANAKKRLSTTAQLIGQIVENRLFACAVQKKDRLNRLLIEHARDGFWRADCSGTILDVNESYCRISGYTRDELIGRHISAVEAAETADEVRAHIARVIEQGSDLFETRHRRRDGSIVPLEISLTYLPENGGLVYTFMRDITARKKAEAALRDSQARYKALVDNIDLGITLLDKEYRIIMVNRKHAGFFKRPADSFPGKFCYREFEHRDRVCAHCPGVVAMKTGKPAEVYTKNVRDDGTTLDARVLAFPLFDNKEPVGFIEVVENITGHTQAAEERSRLSTAIEQAAEVIVITDLDAHIVYANPAFETVTGYSCIEAIGQNPSILKSGQQTDAFYQELWNEISNGRTWRGNFINKKKDGSLYHEEATISAVKNAAGEIINYVAVKRDVSRELEIQEQLRQSQKMEAIGTLAGGIAHDFNNILGGIIGYAEVAKDDCAEGLPVAGYFDDILRLGIRARDLTQQILTFSRRTAREAAPIYLQPVVKECLKMLRATIPTTIDLCQNINQQCGPVTANPVQMHQLIMNLCTNAAQEMMETGGALEVMLDEIEVPEKTTSYDCTIDPGTYVFLRVSDSGGGISPDNLNRIFEPFFTTKEKGKGTGMGLAVVYGIVRSHGGSITVENTAGQGTAFTVLLPRADVAAGPVQEALDEELLPEGNEHILFVDDEDAIVAIAHRLLTHLGYKVTVVQSGLQALALFRDDPGAYDLVITDQTMPQMAGFQLAQELMATRPDIPVILCTGYSETVTEQQAKAAGIREFVSKPIDRATMARTIRAVLDRRGA